jgi:hypothetical protein
MLGDHQHGFAMVYDRAHLGRRERGVDRYRYCADRPDRKQAYEKLRAIGEENDDPISLLYARIQKRRGQSRDLSGNLRK